MIIHKLMRMLCTVVIGSSLVGCSEELIDETSENTTEVQDALVSCSGTACNQLDPNATYCKNDAVTVATTFAQGVQIDLRWSPSCKTNWGRSTSSQSNNHIIYVETPNWPYTGHMETLSDGSGTVRWSKMWYAPS